MKPKQKFFAGWGGVRGMTGLLVMLAFPGLAAESEPPATAAPKAAQLTPGVFHPVDLSKHYTTVPASLPPGDPWEALPSGSQVFEGVPFEIGGRIEVTGMMAAREGGFAPTRVEGIPVGRKACRLFVLHGAAGPEDDGVPTAKLVLRYTDGKERDFRLGYGVHVRNSFPNRNETDGDLADPGSGIAWVLRSGNARSGFDLRVFKTAIENPRPNETIDRVDFISFFSRSTPVLVALTTEEGAAQAERPADVRRTERKAHDWSDAAYRRQFNIRATASAGGPVLTNAAAYLTLTDDKSSFYFGAREADSTGRITLDYPPQQTLAFNVLVKAPGHVPVVLGNARTNTPNDFPDEIVAPLTRGVPIGGEIKDQKGQPVSGAEVVVTDVFRESSRRWTEIEYDRVQTDAAGKWSTTAVPQDFANFQFEVTHPRFRPTRFFQAGSTNLTSTRTPSSSEVIRTGLVPVLRDVLSGRALVPVPAVSPAPVPAVELTVRTPAAPATPAPVVVRRTNTPPARYPAMINLDFGDGTNSSKKGPAATGLGADDFWNLYSRDEKPGKWRTVGTVTNLLYTDHKTAGVNVTVKNAPGAWGNGSADPMYSGYLYPFDGGPIATTVENLPIGLYDVYIYGHEASSNRICAYDLSVGIGETEVSWGSRTNGQGPDWNSANWKEGVQYVAFRGVQVFNSADPVTIIARPPDRSTIAVMAGLQLRFVGSNPGQPKPVAPPPAPTPVSPLATPVMLTQSPALAVAGCVDLPMNAVGWWPGDANGMNLLTSTAGVLGQTTRFTPGQVGQAFLFDGESGLVSDPPPGLPDGIRNRTIECWFKVESEPTMETFIAGYGRLGRSGETYMIGVRGKRAFFSQWGSTCSGGTVNYRQWHHIAVSSIGRSVRLYLDGVQRSSATFSSLSTPSDTPFCIGRAPDSYGDARQFHGAIDEVTVYARALSSEEIRAIYQAGAAGKCKSDLPKLVAPRPTRDRSSLLLSKTDLLERKAVMVLDPAIRVIGSVVDGEGKPVPRADVYYFDSAENRDPRFTAKADDKGSFQFAVGDPGMGAVAVLARGYSPKLVTVTLDKEENPVSVTIRKGGLVRGLVRGPGNQPVSGATVRVESWHENQLIRWQTRAGTDGRFTWDNAPEGPVRLYFTASNYYNTTLSTSLGDNSEVSVMMNRPFVAAGRVVDAETRKPVEEFTVVQGYRYGYSRESIRWQRYNITRGRAGDFSIRLSDYGSSSTNWLLFEAKGYLPLVSAPFQRMSSATDLSSMVVELKKGRGLNGLVELPSGEPVPNCVVVLAERGQQPYMNRPGQIRAGGSNGDSVRTDSRGRFEFAPKLEPRRLFVAHEQGYAELASPDFEKAGKLVLQPWGRIQGTYRVGPAPWADRAVVLRNESVPYDQEEGSYAQLSMEIRAETDANGQFAFERVPPGWRQVAVQYLLPRGREENEGDESYALSHGTPLLIKPDAITEVSLGGGRMLVGRIKTLGAAPTDINWFRDTAMINSRVTATPTFEGPDISKAKTDAERQQIYREFERKQQAFWVSEAGRAVTRRQRQYALLFETNGSFRIESVPPGTYDLFLHLNEREEYEGGGWSYRQIGSLNKEISVPKAPPNQPDEVFDLGEIPMVIKRPLRLGQASPPLETKSMDGKTVKLENFRGTNVLLYFHASWAGNYPTELATLRSLHQSYGGTNGSLVIIGLSTEHNLKAAEDYIKNNSIPWLQCYLGPWAETQVPVQFGVEGVPSAVMIDAKGIIRGKSLRGASIRTMVRNTIMARSGIMLPGFQE